MLSGSEAGNDPLRSVALGVLRARNPRVLLPPRFQTFSRPYDVNLNLPVFIWAQSPFWMFNVRLYYMTSHEVAVEHILPERRMKLSLFPDLNDPFELKPHVMADKLLRRVNLALERPYFGKKGILCFSDNWQSPVMWAHYADKHKGVCLGFDIGELNGEPLAHPVSYAPERLPFQLDQEKDLMGIDERYVRALLYTKAQQWSYEREYRVVANLEVRDEKTGYYYVDFGAQFQLREVVLGARNDMPVGQMAKLVRKNGASVQVLKARPGFHQFEMVRNMRVKAIHVSASR